MHILLQVSRQSSLELLLFNADCASSEQKVTALFAFFAFLVPSSFSFRFYHLKGLKGWKSAQ
jgi:hypothetical protein